MHRLTIAVALVVIALGGAGCGGGEESSGTTDTTVTETTTDGTTTDISGGLASGDCAELVNASAELTQGFVGTGGRENLHLGGTEVPGRLIART